MARPLPHPVDLHVGARIRLRRKMAGVSQEVLARQLGLTFQQLQKYEKADNRISASKLQAVAVALATPVAWFFDGLDGQVAANPDDPSAMRSSQLLTLLTDRDGLALAQAFIPLPRRLRRTLLALIVSLSEQGELTGPSNA